MLYLAISFWLLCSFLSYGILFAYVQREFRVIAKETYREDMSIAMVLSLIAGPMALIMSLAATGFAKHGLKFR